MDLFLSLFCLILGIAIFVISSNYDIFTYDIVGGGGFPRILGGVIIICGILIALQYFRSRKNADDSGKAKKFGNYMALIKMIACLALYVLALERIGYIVSTTSLLSALMFIQEEKGVKRLVGVPVIIVAGLYIIFGIILGVKLPRGFLI